MRGTRNGRRAVQGAGNRKGLLAGGKGNWAMQSLILAALMLATPPAAGAGVGVSLRGEDFCYHLRFMEFLHAADSRLRLRRVSENRYEAELVAETKGFIGFLLAYRKNIYRSEMDYFPGRRRFITHRFTKMIVSGGDVAKSVTDIDYAKREIRWVVTENGAVESEGSEPIPAGAVYEDLLSVFLNLRNGAFGPLTRGRRITVVSLPYYRSLLGGWEGGRKAVNRSFDIRIADASTERAYRRRFDRTGETGLLVLVNVPNDFFGQNSGDAQVWFDRNLIPVSTRVEDVILFGDIVGDLRREGRRPVLMERCVSQNKKRD